MGENLFTAVYDLKKQLAKKIPHKKKNIDKQKLLPKYLF
jgi:hypothetical protein